MNILFPKFFILSLVFIITTLSEVQAEDSFSYTTFNLPYYVYNQKNPWLKVFKSQAELQSFYDERVTEHNKSYLDYPAGMIKPISAPIIDFDQYQVVAGGVGERGTISYDLAVGKIFKSGVDEIMIQVYELTISEGCGGAAYSYPSLALVIKKHLKPRISVMPAQAGGTCLLQYGSAVFYP